MVHAHLALLYRNVEAEDLNARIVFTLLASQVYLFNNYKFDIDVDTDNGYDRPYRIVKKDAF